MARRNLRVTCELELTEAAALAPDAQVLADRLGRVHVVENIIASPRAHDLRGNRPPSRCRFTCGHRQPQEVPMISFREMSFLRAALLIDAVASALTAALLVAGADALRDWLGLPVALMREAGL